LNPPNKYLGQDFLLVVMDVMRRSSIIVTGVTVGIFVLNTLVNPTTGDKSYPSSLHIEAT
jgi:hypothetical protein